MAKADSSARSIVGDGRRGNTGRALAVAPYQPACAWGCGRDYLISCWGKFLLEIPTSVCAREFAEQVFSLSRVAMRKRRSMIYRRLRRSSLSNAERALGLFYLGEAYTALGKPDDALKVYERALVTIHSSKPGSYLEQLLLVKIAQVQRVRGRMPMRGRSMNRLRISMVR